MKLINILILMLILLSTSVSAQTIAVVNPYTSQLDLTQDFNSNVTIDADLNVTGDIAFGGNLTIDTVHASGWINAAYGYFTETLQVIKGVIFSDTLDVGGNLTVTGTTTLYDNLSTYGQENYMHQDLIVASDIKMGDTSNYKLFDIVADGVNVILSAYQNLGLKLVGNTTIEGNLTASRIFGNGNVLSIGSGTQSKGLTSPNDLYITGKLEVDGASYLNGTVFPNALALTDDKHLALGTSDDVLIDWSTAQTEHTLVVGLGDTSESMILTTQTNKNVNHGHSAKLDPTLIIHSSTSAATDATQYGTLSHDKNDFVLDSGNGTVKSVEDFTAHKTLYASQGIDVGQDDGLDLFTIESDGSYIVLEAFQSLPIRVLTYTPNGTAATCFVNDTMSWICEAR